MTSSNGDIFRVTGPLCVEFTGHRWIPLTKASDAELWCFSNLRLNKRLSKPWGWWFETPSCSLWRHCNEYVSVLKYLNIFNWPYQIHLIKTAAFGVGWSRSPPPLLLYWTSEFDLIRQPAWRHRASYCWVDTGDTGSGNKSFVLFSTAEF